MKWLFQRGARGIEIVSQVPDDYVPGPGQIAKPVDDFTIDEMPAAWAANRVWPAAEAAPRPPNATEALTKAKADKADEIRGRATAESEGEYSDVERRMAVGRWARPQTQLSPREQAIVNSSQNRYDKLAVKLDAIDAATTVAQVQAVVW